MPGRADKVAAALTAELAGLIQRAVKDPRVHAAGLLTVTGVRVSDDLTHATVAVSFVGGDPAAALPALKGLERAAGFLRGEAARRLGLKRAPALRFVRDRSAERAELIEALLKGGS